ncbi:MAG: aldehyde dehydrogenase family protein [Verrucomicrobiia bacterium]
MQFAKTTPIDTGLTIGYFQKGTTQDAQDAIAAAKAAFPAWSGMTWKRRVATMRKVAALINRRLFDIAAWVSIEVGKSRAEAIGDVKETADHGEGLVDESAKLGSFRVALLPENRNPCSAIAVIRWAAASNPRRPVGDIRFFAFHGRI